MVRRPGVAKQKSKLRVSFNPDNEDNDSSALPSDSEPFTLPRPPKRSLATSLQDRLKQTSIREDNVSSRPAYSKTALDELRASTPNTPQNLSLTTNPDPEDNPLHLSTLSKFGPQLTSTTTSIPSATEISERKARRARAALEASALPPSTTDPNSEDYIPLDAYDSDGEFKPTRMQLSTWHAPTQQRESRLVPDGEDDDLDLAAADDIHSPFTTTTTATNLSSNARQRNRITTDSLSLTSRSQAANTAARREALQSQILAAQRHDHGIADSDSDSNASDNDDDNDSDDSDARTRHAAYELSQTSHALPSSQAALFGQKVRRPKQPREISQIQKLSVGLAGLRERVSALGVERGRVERRLGEVRREREEVRKRGEVVQRSLEEAAGELEGLNGVENGVGATGGGVEQQGDGVGERGLESIGSGMGRPPSDGYDD